MATRAVLPCTLVPTLRTPTPPLSEWLLRETAAGKVAFLHLVVITWMLCAIKVGPILLAVTVAQHLQDRSLRAKVQHAKPRVLHKGPSNICALF